MSLFSRFKKRRMRKLKLKSREFIQGQQHQRKLDEEYITQKIKVSQKEFREELAKLKEETRKIKEIYEFEKKEMKREQEDYTKKLKLQHKKELIAKDEEISVIFKDYNDRKIQLDKDNQRYKTEMEVDYQKRIDELENKRLELENTIEKWNSESEYLEQCTVDLYNIERLVESHSEPLIKAAVRLAGPDKEAILKMRDLFRHNRKRVLKHGAKIHRISHN